MQGYAEVPTNFAFELEVDEILEVVEAFPHSARVRQAENRIYCRDAFLHDTIDINNVFRSLR